MRSRYCRDKSLIQLNIYKSSPELSSLSSTNDNLKYEIESIGSEPKMNASRKQPLKNEKHAIGGVSNTSFWVSYFLRINQLL